MDFAQALNNVLADLTPQPWTHTTSSGSTLTVIPAGLTAAQGDAEVDVRITSDKATVTEAGVTTTDLPDLIGALEQRTAWEHTTVLNDTIEILFDEDGLVVIVEDDDHNAALRMPEQQRMPLASALRRALDVARGWES